MACRRTYPILAALVVGLLGGCAAGDLIVVMPEEEGATGSVVVRQGEKAIVLDKPFAAARTGTGGTPRHVRVEEKDVRDNFSEALAARPLAPASIILYFREGTTVLVPASRAELNRVFAEIDRRPVPEVTVIGHTDRVGKVADNDRLALRRARAVRESLIGRSIKAEIIDVAGRGEREPLVPTDDEVAEPRNRRS